MKPVEFKKESQRLKDEYEALKTKNPKLRLIIQDLNNYTNKTFNKNIVVTMISRTQDEQDYLYRNSEKYQKKKFKSPHQFDHAVDIRSHTFTRSEIDIIVTWLNEKYDSSNYYTWTSKCHNVGSGDHFHIQFVAK